MVSVAVLFMMVMVVVILALVRVVKWVELVVTVAEFNSTPVK